MPIITISRCSHTHGKEVAEAVAKTLGYTCISREDLIDGSQEFKMHSLKFVRELSIILDQTVFHKRRYISYMRSALLKHLVKGKVVYYNSCGHILLKDIDHVLKVQLTADFEDRVKIAMDREGFSRNAALFFINTMDDAKKKWCRKLCKIDFSGICQYDISLNISKIPIDKSVDIISKTAILDQFKTTVESRKALYELLGTADGNSKKITDFETNHICSIASLMEV